MPSLSIGANRGAMKYKYEMPNQESQKMDQITKKRVKKRSCTESSILLGSKKEIKKREYKDSIKNVNYYLYIPIIFFFLPI